MFSTDDRFIEAGWWVSSNAERSYQSSNKLPTNLAGSKQAVYVVAIALSTTSDGVYQTFLFVENPYKWAALWSHAASSRC